MKFSVIIPAWNEAQHIAQGLKRLREISNSENMEVILVDGGSKDKTIETARKWVDRVETLPVPNRGAQLHAGAKVATGDLLFFLHADTQPPGNWQERLEQFWLKSHKKAVAATVFSVDYGSRWNFHLVAWWQNLRASWGWTAFGDAGFCTTREIYEACGGFPDVPIMEDIIFSRRLRKVGRIVLLPERIHPAGRRLYENGPILNSIRNAFFRAAFAFGASPQRLWRWYYPVRPRDDKSDAKPEAAAPKT